MENENTYNKILINPSKSIADRVAVISDFATPAMVANHFAALRDNVRICLVVGSAGKNGILKAHHQTFMRLQNETYSGRFECYYFLGENPVKETLFLWGVKGGPTCVFSVPASYTYFGMHSKFEVHELTDFKKAQDDLFGFIKSSISCMDSNVPLSIHLFSIPPRTKPILSEKHSDSFLNNSEEIVEISFLDRRGELPARSGLNWGKRPEYKRHPNQAYIRVPREIAIKGFFPPRGIYFTIITDDGKSFDAVIAQSNDKAIETPRNNSLLGKYFRNRLELPDGAEVKKIHLLSYGRTTVTLKKLDEETYFMDFSVKH